MYVVMVENCYVVIDVLRGRFDASELIEHAKSRAQSYRPNHIVIENSFGIGSMLVNHLRGAGFVATPVKPEVDKRTRLMLQFDKIMEGRAQDVSLQANDILFVPNSLAKSASMRALEAAIQTGTGLAIWGPK